MTNSPKMCAPEAAIRAGRRAVELEPDSWRYRNALAIAYFRAELWDDAAREFETCTTSSAGWGTHFYDIYFLAATEHRRGNADKSKVYMELARQWSEKFEAGLPAEERSLCQKFRAEAEEALKLPAEQPD